MLLSNILVSNFFIYFPNIYIWKLIKIIFSGMSRPYPRQLAGNKVKFSFDVEKKTFELVFVAFKGDK